MNARLVFKTREFLPDGSLIEIVIWTLPAATAERPHGFKYRLYCGRGGRCVVRYDNEAGKGDHIHYGDDDEVPYLFFGVAALMRDFRADVARLTGGVG